MPPCLTLSIIRYGSRVKWSNPGKGVAPSPTPWCSKLSKREPSGHPRLWSPTLLTYSNVAVLHFDDYTTRTAPVYLFTPSRDFDHCQYVCHQQLALFLWLLWPVIFAYNVTLSKRVMVVTAFIVDNTFPYNVTVFVPHTHIRARTHKYIHSHTHTHTHTHSHSHTHSNTQTCIYKYIYVRVFSICMCVFVNQDRYRQIDKQKLNAYQRNSFLRPVYFTILYHIF